MPLKENPQGNKKEKSFVRYGIITRKKHNFSSPLNNYKFNKGDFRNVKSKIRNYKKNRNKKSK